MNSQERETVMGDDFKDRETVISEDFQREKCVVFRDDFQAETSCHLGLLSVVIGDDCRREKDTDVVWLTHH